MFRYHFTSLLFVVWVAFLLPVDATAQVGPITQIQTLCSQPESTPCCQLVSGWTSCSGSDKFCDRGMHASTNGGDWHYFCSGDTQTLVDDVVQEPAVVDMGQSGLSTWSMGAKITCTKKYECKCDAIDYFTTGKCGPKLAGETESPVQTFNDLVPEGGACVGMGMP